MAYPRRLLVDPHVGCTYHCISRCVRRAFLCGFDRQSGRSFEHRKQWVEQRLTFLAGQFAVDVLAYAIMSNHLHVVVHIDPLGPRRWSARATARRWLCLFRPRGLDERAMNQRVSALARDKNRMEVIRQRLGSLSWFMRCLNEPIARRANREDECTGRFWEGRFKCQALLDEAAVLACMVYVDLNPHRVRATNSYGPGLHTSARARARRPARQGTLGPVAGSLGTLSLSIDESAYLSLLRWSAYLLHPRRRAVPPRAPPTTTFARLGLHPEQWCNQVEATEIKFFRAIGSPRALREKATRMGQRWLCGVGFARLAAAPG